MATLNPGTTVPAVVNALPSLTVTAFTPNTVNFSLGSFSIVKPDGYLYSPPLVGQIWPRGDYAPSS